MKKFPIVLAAVALVAAGCFAAASIASGGSFARMLTGTTATVPTVTTTHTDTNEHEGGHQPGRRVALCHKTGPKKSPKFHTITVDQHAVKAHLKHGDTLGVCPPKAPATTTSTTTTTSSDDHGKGSDHGNSGDHGNNGNNGNGKGHGKP